MPSSSYKTISDTIEIIMKIQPNKILDVGCGFGKWGFLCREYLEIYGYRYNKDKWIRRIDTVEVYPNYITSIHKHLYDNIYIENILDFVNKMEEYDLIILSDIIEHFEKETAIKLLDDLYKKANYILIITPNGFEPQTNSNPYVRENKYEEHKCGFIVADFKKYNAQIKKCDDKLLVLIKTERK